MACLLRKKLQLVEAKPDERKKMTSTNYQDTKFYITLIYKYNDFKVENKKW